MPFPFPFTLFGANRSSNTPSEVTCDFTYCYGGDWVQGKVGNYGMQFDGTEDYIECDTLATSMQGLDKFSVSFWGSSSAYGTPAAFVLSDGGNASEAFLIYPYDDGGSGNGLRVWYNGATTIDEDSATRTGWNHFVYVQNSTTDHKAYANGVEIGSSTTSKTLDGQLDEASIGGTAYFDGQYFAGKLDEVAVWDTAITPAQISLLSTGSARADSITPPEIISDYGDWSTTYKKIGTYGIGLFNGSNDVISLTPSSSMAFDAGDAWSWSGWYYPTNLGATTYNFLFAQGPSGGASFAHGYGTKIYFGESRNPYLSNGYIQKHTVAGELTLNAWNHVVITCNGNGISSDSATRAAAYTCYVNATASSIESTDSNTQLISASGQLGNLYMGGRVQGNLSLYGYIDDTAMFDVGLDATAVAQIYESGSANVGAKASNVSSSALVGYWDMDSNGPGSTTVSGAFGQHGVMGGTLTGGTSTTGSLLLYYDFEIGDNNPVSGNFPTSTTVYDVVTASFHPPTAHTGTMTNMSVADFGNWTQGKLGKYSLDFNGSHDYVDLPLGACSGSSNGQSGSISAWIYADDFNTAWTGYPVILGTSKNSATQEDYMRFNISTNGSCLGNLAFGSRIGTDYGPNVYAKTGGTNNDGKVVAGEWTHVVITCDGTTKNMYLNGTSSAFETSLCSGGEPDGTWFADFGGLGDRNVQIAGIQWNGTNPYHPFDGKMDEVAVWSEVLNLGGVQALYNDGTGVKANTVSSSYLVSYYDMECDGPGSANLKDLSGNSYDGTLSRSVLPVTSGSCGEG